MSERRMPTLEEALLHAAFRDRERNSAPRSQVVQVSRPKLRPWKKERQRLDWRLMSLDDPRRLDEMVVRGHNRWSPDQMVPLVELAERLATHPHYFGRMRIAKKLLGVTRPSGFARCSCARWRDVARVLTERAARKRKGG